MFIDRLSVAIRGRRPEVDRSRAEVLRFFCAKRMEADVGRAFAEGGCACRLVRYRLLRAPIFVHCCHCSWCQRETGSAFAVNAMIETAEIGLVGPPPELTPTPSESGDGQKIMRCPACRVAVWSH